MKPMLTYFFRSAQAAAFFIVLHVFTTIAIIWCLREFDVCDPWNYFYLELMAFTLIMYWVLSNKHRQKLIALADPVKYRYPDIEYGGPEGITPTWPGGVPIHDGSIWQGFFGTCQSNVPAGASRLGGSAGCCCGEF